MAYHLDGRDIVIDGWENGIADDPYAGISDLRNINLISIPKEASVNFSTVKNSPSQLSGNVTSANAGADTVLLTGYSNLADLQAITFAGGSLPGGIVAGTVYWVVATGGGNFQLYTNWATTATLDITSSGTGTWATVDMAVPKYFSHYMNNYIDGYFMVDALGKIWSNTFVGSAGLWRYFATSTGSGNGIVSYFPSNTGSAGTGYLFVLNAYSIDYWKIVKTSGNYTVTAHAGWNPSTGTDGNSNYLKCYTTLNGVIHEAMVGPDNKVYYTDSNWIGRFYQTAPGTPFDPTNTSTYTFDTTSVLPITDQAQCLTFLGNNLLIGGINNIIYPWDTFSSLPAYPIILAESNIQKMVTVNTNAYALVGNRGRVYYTNGAQAQLYKKIPDHLSGTVEPYYTWGGLASLKNQIYFSALATTNSGSSITAYGGVWAIDIDTKALRLTNKLSYGTYAGYATAIIPNFSANPAGTGMIIGWNNGVSVNAPNNGIDATQSQPYIAGEAYVDSDMIPVGQFQTKKTYENLEYKLTTPLVSGETVALGYRTNITDSYTDVPITQGNATGDLSGFGNVNFENVQWIQVRATLTATASTPSYVRLKELRIR